MGPAQARRAARPRPDAPSAAKRSMNFGRKPFMANRPFTRPLSSIPVCSKAKISCMVTVLPSMPVISWKLTTLRLPSTRREMWTMTWMAELM